MQWLGAPAGMPELILDHVASATAAGLAFVVFSDGDDLTCIFADAGETVEAVQALAARAMPWGAA